MSIGIGGTLRAPSERDPLALESPCPRCGTPWNPRLRELHHDRMCRKRSAPTTVRNLLRMYANVAKGRGCAQYIRDQEWAHLRKALRR